MRTSIKSHLVDIFSCITCSTIARKIFGSGIPIFMLHRMREQHDKTQHSSATSDTHLRHCLEYLKQNQYHFLSIRELALAIANDQPLPDRCVVFTMDDGFEDQARIATPIFHEYDCPATIFLITGMLDGKIWPWDDKIAYLINKTSVSSINITIGENKYQFSISSEQDKKFIRRKIQDAIKSVPFEQLNTILEDLESIVQINIPESPPPQNQPLTWDQVRNYEKQGIEFAPHSVSHAILSKLDPESVKQEIIGSWQRMRDELTNPCPVFCYPTGRYCDFGPREIKLLRENGFIGAVSTIPAQVRPDIVNYNYVYGLPRYALPSSFNDFKIHCSWLEYVRERNLRFWSN